MADFILAFFLKYIPFWAVPAMLLSTQFGLTFKKRSKTTSLKLALGVFTFSFLSLVLFVWAGSPWGAVNTVSEFLHLLEN